MAVKPLFGTYIDITTKPIDTIAESDLYYGTLKSQGIFIANRLTAVIYKDSGVKKTVIGKIEPEKSGKISMQYKNGLFKFKNFSIHEDDIKQGDDFNSIADIFNIYLTKHPIPIEADNIIQADKEILSKFNACFCMDYSPKMLFSKPFNYGIFDAVVITDYIKENACYNILKAENKKITILTVLCNLPKESRGGILLNDAIQWVGKSIRIGYSKKGYLTVFNRQKAILFKHIKKKGLAGKVSEVLFDFFCRTVLNKEMDTVYQCRSADTQIDEKLESVITKTTSPTISDMLFNYNGDSWLNSMRKNETYKQKDLLYFGDNEAYITSQNNVVLNFTDILIIKS